MTEATDTRLRLLVDRIERLMEERKGISADIRDVFSEAKAVGYDTPTLRRAIARRAIKPEDRAEADDLLATYEAALDGADVVIPDARPDLRALAEELLEEQLAGIEDPTQAAKLVEHVTVLLDIRAEIAALREQEAARKALAKGEGFMVTALNACVRWIEKCAKHGRDAMRAGEATYQMYRGTVEGRGSAPGAVTDDPKLQSLVAKPKSGGKLDATIAWLSMGGRDA